MSVESKITLSDTWFRGEDKTLEFTVFQKDGVTVQNIAGWTLEYELCQLDGTAIFTKTTGGSTIVITDAVNGVLQVLVLDTDTDALTKTKFKHELRRTDDGFEATLVHGTVRIDEAC